jgi:hypothetical protein
MLNQIWKPAVYHGKGKQGVFFEGWYFKLISPDQDSRWAVIPGIFKHPDPDQAHAFIQVLNGMTGQVTYHRFPPDAFHASSRKFEIQIAENHFDGKGLTLDLKGEDQILRGRIRFSELQPWPVRWNSPGVMGPYRFAPFMQTYHGVLSLDHELGGTLDINRERVNFSGGRGYIEKDWGKTFPRAYIWSQSNHFGEEGISLTASVATIPWLGSWFRGFLVGFRHRGRLYRFTTYLGSRIDRLKVSDQNVIWDLTGTWRTLGKGGFPAYRLSLEIARGEGGLLSSPELEGMTPRILESLTAEVRISLEGLDGGGRTLETLYQGAGTCAALEVAGTVGEIADQDA